MGTVFRNAEGCELVEFLAPGETINADRHVKALNKLRRVTRALSVKRPENDRIFLHDNARPHFARSTTEKIEKKEWEVLPHTAYSPKTAPFGYHLSSFVKKQMRSQR